MEHFNTTEFKKPFVLILFLLFTGFANVRAATYVVTNTNITGAGSLTEAITLANGTAADDIITFNIAGAGPHLINYGAGWVTPTQVAAAGGGLLIDGFSQPGASGCNVRIQINGQGGWDAWLFSGVSNVTLRGLSLTNLYVNFNGGSNNRVYGCYFDITPAGVLKNDLGTYSLIIQNGSTGNIVGGLGCNFRNVFGGAGAQAIYISESSNNTVVGNYIGTNLTGNALLGNFTAQGIYITGVSSGVRIDSNVVVGCAAAGIFTSTGTTNNLVIRGNYLGIRADGALNATDYGNGQAGIYINSFANGVNINGNVVCDNGSEINLADNSGIFIYANAVTITNVQITNNHVGVGPAPGYTAKGNDFAGIYLQGTGGSITNVTLSGNIIGDNGDNPNQKSSGIATLDIPNGNLIFYNNYIGMTPSGADRGNYHNGMEIFNTSGVTIGGSGVNQRNFIGYNKALRPVGGDPYGAGILITSTTANASNNIDIINNYIGVQPDGVSAAAQPTSASTSANCGIVIENSANIRIGGTLANQSNIIANAGGDGINVVRSSDWVQIRRNSIYCNGLKGINLNLATATPGNTSYAAPVIDLNSITANSVSGTCPSGAIVEIFYDADGGCARACSDPNKRQGKVYLGTATTTGTTWTYTHSGAFTGNLTATATGGCTGGIPDNCRTSEFATCASLCTDATAPTSVSVDRNNFCTNDAGNISLSATGGSGNAFRWYTSSCGGTLVGTGNPLSIPSPTTTTTYYGRWEASAGCNNSTCLSVTVTVSALPSSANAGTDINLCNATSTTLSGVAPTPASATGVWSVISGTATITNPNSPTSGVTGLGTGIITLRWTVSNGGCTSASFDDVQITNYALPSAANAGSDINLCNAASTTLSAIAPTPATATGVWSVVSGIATITNPNSPTSGVTGLGTGVVVLRWTVSNGSCSNSSFDDVQITNYALPSAANAGTDINLCNATSTTLSAVAPTPASATGMWSVVSGTATITNPNSPTSGVTGLGTGIITLRWTVSNGSCSNSSFDDVQITNYALPSAANAGIDRNLCGATNTTLAAVASTPATATGQWSVISGTATITNPNSPTSGVTGLGTGTVVLRWTVSNGSCSNSSFDDMQIINSAGPSAANAGTDINLCNATTTTLAAVVPTPATATGAWTVVSGTATFTNTNSPTSGVTGLGTGITILRWTVSEGACTNASFDDVQITNYVLPSTANAGTDINLCNASSTTLAALTPTPATATGVWSVISGTVTITNPANPSSGVTGLGTGVITLRWTVSNGSCSNTSFDDVQITNYALPSSANAGTDINLCNATSTTLAAVAPTPATATGVWSVVSGTATISNPNSPNSGVTGLINGVVTLRWTVSNGSCSNSSFDDVQITNYSIPVVNAGSDQTICTTTTTLSGSDPLSGTGVWSTSASGVTFVNINDRFTQVSGLPANSTTILTWTVTNGTCAPVSDQISVITQPSAITSVTIDPSAVTICSGTSVIFTATPVNGGTTPTYKWFLNNVEQAGQTSATYSSSTLVNNDKVYVEMTSSLACASGSPANSNEVTVSVSTPPSPFTTGAGADQIICSSTSANISAEAPTTGTGMWSIVAPAGSVTLANPALASTSISGLGIGNTIKLVWTVTNSPCASISDTLQITNHTPVASSAGPDQSLCYIPGSPDNTITLNATIPSATYSSGSWSVVQGAVTLANNSNPSTTATITGAGSILLRWNVSSTGCVNIAADTVQIMAYNQPTIPTAGSSMSVCSSTAALSGNYPTHGSGVWSTQGGTSVIFDDPTDPHTDVHNLPIGTTVLRWTISNGSCSSASANVTITRNQPTETADAGSDKFIKCSPATTLSAKNAAGTWSVGSGTGTLVNSNDPATVISNLSLGVNRLYWTVSGLCGISRDSIDIHYAASDIVVNASAPSDTSCAGTSKDLQVSVKGGSGDFTYQWYTSDNNFNVSSNNTVVTATPQSFSTTYYVVVKDNKDISCSSNIDSVTVYTIQRQELIIPNLMTPNGDNMNDALMILDVNNKHILPGSTLQVYNRWGQRVYMSDDYDNKWKAENISDGMYFYQLETGCGDDTYKGWLQILGNVNN